MHVRRGLRRTTTLTLRLEPQGGEGSEHVLQAIQGKEQIGFYAAGLIMQAIIGRFDAEHPTLWEQGETDSLLAGAEK
ncbi:MAG: hypothetical protein MZV63_40565 [Marinilabiliales bacterium]|nr:hypothetical protein [Marinilabiliales bacterium]